MNYLRLGALVAAVVLDYTNIFTISAATFFAHTLMGDDDIAI